MVELIKNKHYYNNSYEVNNGVLFLDRVYMVDEYRFKDSTYDELAKIYRILPEFVFNPTNVCCWYGDKDKGDKYYLYISFESSGLQIVGNLPLMDFENWEKEFHKEIVRIPFKR